ncbi:MAG: type II toxin-antitoxin system VapC family toxin [Candidatus Limnocylindria bacterium]
MITIDTSAVLAIANRRDRSHQSTVDALRADRGPYLVPAGILGEATFMLERRMGTQVLDAFLADLESGAYSLDCGNGDVARIRELVNRYAGLPLGFADAAVVACAERSGGRVLTLDLRDFGVVARDVQLNLLPLIVD